MHMATFPLQDKIGRKTSAGQISRLTMVNRLTAFLVDQITVARLPTLVIPYCIDDYRSAFVHRLTAGLRATQEFTVTLRVHGIFNVMYNRCV